MAASRPNQQSGPLAGVRVLDLTSVVLGPYATQMLGDLGADIIKIEPPEGDTTRYTGPRVSRDMASLFMGVNRNKRSIVLDLKTASAREALLRMVDRADVFVHNIRPQKLEPLGLGSDTLTKRNPRLIYAGIHGWREDGPYSGRPAYDDIIQGLCGVASLMDQLTGEPRYAPTILWACTTSKGFPRSCLVIDDNLQKAQFVKLRDGRLVPGDTIKLIRNKFKKKKLELDGEGIAFSKGFYYVIGSHGHPRDSEKKLDPVDDRDKIDARIKASSQIVRFRAKDGADAKVEPTTNLKKIIATEPDP